MTTGRINQVWIATERVQCPTEEAKAQLNGMINKNHHEACNNTWLMQSLGAFNVTLVWFCQAHSGMNREHHSPRHTSVDALKLASCFSPSLHIHKIWFGLLAEASCRISLPAPALALTCFMQTNPRLGKLSTKTCPDKTCHQREPKAKMPCPPPVDKEGSLACVRCQNVRQTGNCILWLKSCPCNLTLRNFP